MNLEAKSIVLLNTLHVFLSRSTTAMHSQESICVFKILHTCFLEEEGYIIILVAKP